MPEKLPYASMAAWFGGAPKALLVLAEFAPNDQLVWHSAEGQAITTQGAFVVRAIGTELELRDSRLTPPITDLRSVDGKRAERWFDVSVEDRRTQFVVRSKFDVKAIDNVDILGEKRRLRHITEAVSSGGKPRYSNEYWIDESDGFCWKSRQIVVPTMPPLTFEIVKRANPRS